LSLADPETSAALTLLSAKAVRERAHRMLAIGLEGKLPNFRIDLDRMDYAVDLVLETTRKAYPSFDVPFHSRWRHFVLDGHDRWASFADAAGWRDRVAGICRRLRDALLSHTDGAELVSASFAAGQSEAMAQILVRLTTAAADAGVAPTHAGLAARTVVYYVLGFTADEQSRLQLDAAGAELPDGQSILSEDPSARFAFGLRLLVDGIAVHSDTVVGGRD